MKTASPPVPATVFYRFRFPNLDFDIDFIPHTNQAAAEIRRKARVNRMALRNYLHDQVLGVLALGKPK